MSQPISYRDSGFKYVEGIEKVIFSNGICLTIAEFKEHDKDGTIVREILQRQREGFAVYDFNHAVVTGTLRELPKPVMEKPDVPVRKPKQPPKGAYEYDETSVPEGWDDGKGGVHEEDIKSLDDKIIEEFIQEAAIDFKEPVITGDPLPREVMKQIIEDATKEALDDGVVKPKLTVPGMVEFVMFLVAGGSAIMSAYHTTIFMNQSGKPFWISLLTGVIMIFFSATSFTAARFFLEEKNASMVFGFMFILLGVGVVGYSMFSTITVNYNQFRTEKQKETENLIENSTELAVETERSFLLISEMERLDKEIERLNIESEGWRNQSWRRYDEYTVRIDNLQAERREIFAQIERAGFRRIEAEGNVEASRGDIYTFVSQLFSLREDIIRFLIYVIPAIFYDIASPFGFSIILLLEEKRRRRK